MSLLSHSAIQSIFTLWFSPLTRATKAPKPENMTRWFQQSKEFDDQCISDYKPVLENVKQAPSPANAEEALADIILLDQLSRNCYRSEQARIYNHFDVIARDLLVKIQEKGFDSDTHWTPPWRMWFYMPLMHSEKLQDHEKFREIVTNMKESSAHDADAVRYIDGCLQYGQKHADIIAKFGRYPHRNEVLGRKPTESEEKYLSEGGETFGTKSK